MPTTSRGYPYPLAADLPDVPADLQALADALDVDVQTLSDAFDAHAADGTGVHGITDTSLLRTSADVPIIRAVRKTADETVNNSSTLQNDDHLALTVGANEVWQVELTLLLSAANTTADWKFGFTGPAASQFRWAPFAATRWLGATTPAVLHTISDSEGTGSENGIHGQALLGIYLGGANAGTLQFQWAQNAANLSDSKLLIGSCLIATKLS